MMNFTDHTNIYVDNSEKYLNKSRKTCKNKSWLFSMSFENVQSHNTVSKTIVRRKMLCFGINDGEFFTNMRAFIKFAAVDVDKHESVECSSKILIQMHSGGIIDNSLYIIIKYTMVCCFLNRTEIFPPPFK